MLRTAMLMSIIATLCAGLSGCGLKGDLYMPDRPHAEQTTSQQSGRCFPDFSIRTAPALFPQDV